MKCLALLTVAISLATTVNLWGDEQRPNPYVPGANAAPGQPMFRARLKSAAQWYIESLDPVVGLTDAQKKAITEVIESRDKAMQEFQGKNAEKLSAAGKALGEAYQKNDKEAIAKAQKAYQEAYVPVHQAMKESQKKLEDILTPEQKQKQADHQMATWIKALTDPIELSEEQKQKAKAALREIQKDTNNERTERGMPEAIRKILTPQQRAALNKHRLGSYLKMMFARVKLTDEQNKKVDALVDKISQDPNLTVDWKLYQTVSPKVEELLTKEQKEALKQPMRWAQAGGGIGAFGGFAAQSPQAMLGQVGQYWIGLSVEPLTAQQRKKLGLPDDQGLTVLAVSPESPAAKAGIKTNDVIVKAGDRLLKSVQDLVQAVAQAKEKDLGLNIIRDGKKQNITVKPAKRPAEGMVVFQVQEGAEGKTPGSQPTVRRLLGGGLEVIIGEGSSGVVCKEKEKSAASAMASVGERIKHRHELAEKAWQAFQKMQSLGKDKKSEAHELWEQIESLEAQLRQTFAPAGGIMNLPPGAPLILNDRSVSPWRPLAPGQSVPSAQAIPSERRQDAAIQELRAKVEQLRRDVDELKARRKNR